MSELFNEIDGFFYTGGCFKSVAFFLINAKEELTQEEGINLCEELFPESSIGAITLEQEQRLVKILAGTTDLSSLWLGLTANFSDIEFIDSNLTDFTFFQDTSRLPWVSNTSFEVENGGVVLVREEQFSWEVRDSIEGKADGVLCRDNQGTVCYDDTDDHSIFLFTEPNDEEDELYFVPFTSAIESTFEDGRNLCNSFSSVADLVLSEIRTFDEFNNLSQFLFFEDLTSGGDINSFRDEDRAYWLGIQLNANFIDFDNEDGLLIPEEAYVFENDVSFEVVDIDLLSNLKKFPWHENQPNIETDSNITYGVALTRSKGKVLLRLYPIDTQDEDLSGVVCRKLFVGDENEPNELNELIGTVIVAGSIALTTCICFVIVLYKLYLVNKENQQLKKFVKNEKKELLPKMTEIKCTNIDTMTDDNYSIVSGISELQRRRSMGENSIHTLQSKRSQISASERAHDLKIKSILSNRSELTEISRKLLNVSPFIQDIKDLSELLKFYQKVADFLEQKIKEDKERDNSDETFKAFDIDEIPEVGLSFYVKRLVNGLNLWFNDEHMGEVDEFIGIRALLLALHLIRKANVEHPLTECNVHKLLCTTMLVAVKFIEDEVITNDFWADIAGIMPSEVNRLEEIFCFALNFNFEIDEEEINFSLTKFRL